MLRSDMDIIIAQEFHIVKNINPIFRFKFSYLELDLCQIVIQIDLTSTSICNHAFETTRLFGIVVDYEREPERFHRYSPEDQAVIRNHMQRIHDKYGHESPQ